MKYLPHLLLLSTLLLSGCSHKEPANLGKFTKGVDHFYAYVPAGVTEVYPHALVCSAGWEPWDIKENRSVAGVYILPNANWDYLLKNELRCRKEIGK